MFSGRALVGLRQRFGNFASTYAWQHKKRLWFHAASVGEVKAVVALVSALQDIGIQADIVISTVTEQGLLAAKRQCNIKAYCLFAPVDLPWVIERFLREIKPSVYICLETELWPNILRMTKVHGIKTLLLNGRLSEGSFQNYKRIKPFMGQVLACFDMISVIQSIDRDRFLALGLDPKKIEVHGNVKYDLRIAALLDNKERRTKHSDTALRESITKHYQQLLDIDQNQPVLLAGSTHSGEEPLMLTVHDALTATISNLVVIIAPRHPDRLDQIKADFQRKGIVFQTFSQVGSGQRTAPVIIVDRMGELARLYAVATYVFCGGSLVQRGGHNIMEPALWGKSPFYGPHMNDFSDARTLLESADAGFTINNVQELVDKICYFHHHQDAYQQASHRALSVASAQQESSYKQADMICQALG